MKNWITGSIFRMVLKQGPIYESLQLDLRFANRINTPGLNEDKDVTGGRTGNFRLEQLEQAGLPMQGSCRRKIQDPNGKDVTPKIRICY